MRQARFPAVTTLEAFEFPIQPWIDCKVVHQLAGLAFVKRAMHIGLPSSPGVGKTYIAIGLRLKAIESGHPMVFTTLGLVMTQRYANANTPDARLS